MKFSLCYGCVQNLIYAKFLSFCKKIQNKYNKNSKNLTIKKKLKQTSIKKLLTFCIKNLKQNYPNFKVKVRKKL